MANTTITPNMNLPSPVPSEDPGPDWATNINACLYAIDSHNHSTGQGVPITPSGLSINDDLPMNGNDLTTVRSVRFDPQSAVLTDSADVGCLYESGVDLYYNDGSGNHVRITQSGSVTGSAGTITGLPSGTASASFAGGTFTFDSATNTPATMAVGPLVIGSATVSPKTVTLAPSASQPSNYSLTFPLAAPAANQVPISDGSGNLSWTLGVMPLGSVIATFPNLSGAYTTSATTAADAYGFVKCNGQTISDVTSPMNGVVVPNINNTVFLAGNTTAGTSGGSATSSGLIAHTHTFTSSTIAASSTHSHFFPHNHQWGYNNFSPPELRVIINSSNSSPQWTTGASLLFSHGFEGSGFSSVPTYNLSGDASTFTSGALNPPGGTLGTAATNGPNDNTNISGTTDSTGSGSSFSILPTYITAVYLMRVK